MVDLHLDAQVFQGAADTIDPLLQRNLHLTAAQILTAQWHSGDLGAGDQRAIEALNDHLIPTLGGGAVEVVALRAELAGGGRQHEGDAGKAAGDGPRRALDIVMRGDITRDEGRGE